MFTADRIGQRVHTDTLDGRSVVRGETDLICFMLQSIGDLFGQFLHVCVVAVTVKVKGQFQFHFVHVVILRVRNMGIKIGLFSVSLQMRVLAACSVLIEAAGNGRIFHDAVHENVQFGLGLGILKIMLLVPFHPTDLHIAKNVNDVSVVFHRERYYALGKGK